jgi:hypothetical protein
VSGRRSQKASFLTVEEEAVPTTTVSTKSVSSALNRAGTPEKKVVLRGSIRRQPGVTGRITKKS